MGVTPRRLEPLSPPLRQPDLQRSPPTHTAPLTTAVDLLQNVLGRRSQPPALSHHQRALSTPAVNLIPGNSIWSSNDSSSFQYSSGNRGLGNGSQYVTQTDMSQPAAGAPLPPTQSSWSSSYPWQSPLPSQNTQLGYINGSSRPFLPQQPTIVGSGHHRLPSDAFIPTRSQALPQHAMLPVAHRYDSLNSSTLIGSSTLNAAYGVHGSGMSDRLTSAGYTDVFTAPPSGLSYLHNATSQPELFHHTAHVNGEHSFIPQYDGAPAASRIWGNTG